MTCQLCGIYPAMPGYGVCVTCERKTGADLVLEPPEIADGGVVIRQLCIAGCESEERPEQMHLLEQ